MKKILILALLPLAFSAVAKTKIVEPNLKLGHWIITVDNSHILEQALAGMPPGKAGAQAREAMKNFMPASIEVDQCLTAGFFDEAKKKMAAADASDCEMEVLKSSSRKMIVLTKCSDVVSTSTSKFLNSKYYESVVVSTQDNDAGEKEMTIKSVAKWQSASCPAEIAGAEIGGDETLVSKTIDQQTQRQKDRVKSRAKRAENRAVDKTVDKTIDKIFGGLFN